MKVFSLGEFQAEAARFAASLMPRERATLVTLSGVLGSGKTTFVQALAKYFGITETVTSPTFVIEKVYELESTPFKRLVHIDAYRIEDAHELEMLGWAEVSADKENLILLEWPENVARLVPPEAIRLAFDIIDDARIISVTEGAYGKKSSEKDVEEKSR